MIAFNNRNPLKLDPSRTKSLRDRFSRDMSKRILSLKRFVIELIVEEDAFGLSPKLRNPIVGNQRFRFLTDEQKARQFFQMIQQETLARVLQETQQDQWLQAYIEEGYRKGLGRAFDDVNNPEMQEVLDFFRGRRIEFLRAAFNAPVSIERVKLLAVRS